MATNQDLIDAINALTRITLDSVQTQKALAAQQAAATAAQKQANAQAAATRAANQQAAKAAAAAQKAADQYAASAPGRLAAVRSGAYAKEYAEKLRVEAANRQAAQAERAAENRAKYGRFGGIAGAYQSVGGPGLAGGTYGAIQVAQAAGTQFRDPYQSNGAGAYNTFKSIPGVGYAAAAGESIGGRTSRVEADRVAASKLDVISAGVSERQGQTYQLGRQADQTGSRAAVLAGASVSRFAGGDRSTAKGEREYQFALRLLPLQDSQAKAEREQTIAVKDREAAQRRLVGLEQQEATLFKKRAELESALSGTGGVGSSVVGDGDRTAYASGVVKLNEQIEATKRLRERATQDVAGARAAEARAGGATRESQIAIGQEQLSQTRELGAGYRQTAQRLGSLGVGGRAAAKSAYDIVKQIGIDNAGPDLVAQARQYAPDEIGKLEQAAGAASGEYAAGVRGGVEGFGDIAANQQSEVQQTNRLRELGLSNEAATAKGVDAALGSGLAVAIDKLIAERIDEAVKAIDAKLVQQRAINQ